MAGTFGRDAEGRTGYAGFLVAKQGEVSPAQGVLSLVSRLKGVGDRGIAALGCAIESLDLECFQFLIEAVPAQQVRQVLREGGLGHHGVAAGLNRL